MRLCSACGRTLDGPGWTCGACGHAPPCVDGIAVLSSLPADSVAGFDEDFFAPLERVESGSFWFRARNVLILRALARHAAEAKRFLEVGCGTGFVLAAIRERFPALDLTGSEAFVRGLKVAHRRLPGLELLQLDARSLPFREHFDAIGAFDVLEHIAEDEAVLAQFHAALRPGGVLLLTVPQHPFLWSGVDVLARHQRRYRRKELLGKLRRAGFGIRQATSFVTLLLPVLLLSRLRHGRTGGDRSGAELSLPPFLDAVLGGVMALERGILRTGLSLPAGGSLLVVADKPGAVA